MTALHRKPRRSLTRDPALLADFARHAWLCTLVRAIVALCFGGALLFLPRLALRLVITFFGACLVIDGSFSAMTALGYASRHRRSVWLLVSGAWSVLFGTLILFRPSSSASWLFYALAIWAFGVALCELNFAFWIRTFLAGDVYFILRAVAGVALGAWLIVASRVAGVEPVRVLSMYGIGCGLLLLGGGLRLRTLT